MVLPMIRRIGVAMGLMLGIVSWAGPAHAATGQQKFWLIFGGDPRAGAPGTVLASGVVNGRGTDVTIDQHVNPDGSETDIDLITLPGGTITIEDTDPGGVFAFDERACVARLSTDAGTFTVKSGTGAYNGASGGGTFSARGVVIFDRLPGGGCSEEPRSFSAVVSVTGTITVP
jgi:hypothetical protein